MQEFIKKAFSLLLSFAMLAGILYMGYWLLRSGAHFLRSLDSSVGGDVITVSGAIIIASVTVVLGQYLKSRSEIRADLRERKIEVYDEFLKELFLRFAGSSKENEDDSEDDEDLVKFLKDWQRKMVLRGGNNVLVSYINWKIKLEGIDADSVFSTDELLKSIRKDIGQSNRGLEKGFFTHFWLRSSVLFLAVAKNNPKITLAELSEMEKLLEDKDA